MRSFLLVAILFFAQQTFAFKVDFALKINPGITLDSVRGSYSTNSEGCETAPTHKIKLKKLGDLLVAKENVPDKKGIMGFCGGELVGISIDYYIENNPKLQVAYFNGSHLINEHASESVHLICNPKDAWDYINNCFTPDGQDAKYRYPFRLKEFPIKFIEISHGI